MMLRHGSLFAGIEGFGLGFQQAGGIETVWCVEKDANCRDVLALHFPDAAIHDEVLTCGRHNLTPVDIMTFGSPCTDLSVAGKREGLGGEQSKLFFEAIRICGELKPSLAVFENVPGVFSSHAGRDFRAVLMAFRELGARDIGWATLNAQYFGVAQRRRRVFVVSDFAGERAAEILFESESMRWHPAPRSETGQGAAATLGGGSGSRGWSSDVERMTFVPERHAEPVPILDAARGQYRGQSMGVGHEGEPMFTLTAMEGHGVAVPFAAVGLAENQRHELELSDIAHQLKSGGGKPGQGYPAVLEPLAVSMRGRDGGASVETSETMPAMRSSQGGSDKPMVLAAYQQHGSNVGEMGTLRAGNGAATGGVPFVASPLMAASNDKCDPELMTYISHPLIARHDSSEDGTGRGTPLVTAFAWQQGEDSKHGKDGRGRSWVARAGDYAAGLSATRHDAIAGPAWGVRRLTPIECERLQGFPDGWTERGANGKIIADSVRYRMLGNAVCVNVSRWLGQRITALTQEQAA